MASIATTLSPTRDTLSSSQLLSSSISSLSSASSRHTSSQITKIYRQASTLFLTRRLPESLSTILPIITPPQTDDTDADAEPAPVFKAGKTTRVKVWSLYLTILNAVLELDPDEGKQTFGSSEWRSLVTKVRDGEVWEEVVKNGYGGVEGDVDSDVVINLATLLLAHARTQLINQQRLEAYLASSSTPSYDLTSCLTSNRPHRTLSPSKSSGTDTPRDLASRVKILELYTLHVLLRNNEWTYAREFITLSPVLDDERREAFLQALESLHEEWKEGERREREQQRYQEEQLKRDMEEARRRRVENEQREREERERREKGRDGSDYGVEDTPRPSRAPSKSSVKPPSTTSNSNTTPKKSTKPTSNSKPHTSPTSRKSIPAKKVKAPPTLITRAGNLLSNTKNLLSELAVNFQTRPMFLLQFIAFLIGFLAILSRRDVKERLKRILAGAWGKVRQTAGMGVKVSYI